MARMLAALAALTLLFAQPALAQLVFDDGGHHVIDQSDLDRDVSEAAVRDGPSGDSTSLKVTGASNSRAGIVWLAGYDHSVIELNLTVVNYVDLHDEAQLTLRDASSRGFRVCGESYARNDAEPASRPRALDGRVGRCGPGGHGTSARPSMSALLDA